MNTAQNVDVIWYILASTLVISALFARRISLRGALGMAMIWVAIFSVVLVLFTYRNDFGTMASKVQTEVMGQADQHAEGQNLRVKMADDGHFWVDGEINGTAARFLVDSGATITAVSDDVAMKAGLNVDMNGPGLMMQTANGPAVARRSSIAGLAIGPIHTSDLPIVVSDRFNGVNVLGMNFLSRLRSWRVENGEMVMEP